MSIIKQGKAIEIQPLRKGKGRAPGLGVGSNKFIKTLISRSPTPSGNAVCNVCDACVRPCQRLAMGERVSVLLEFDDDDDD